MNINELFSPSLCAVCKTGVTNKKKALEKISKLVCTQDPEIKYHHILDALQRRERMGCTALGHGVAIPHARVDDLAKPLCVVLYVPQPIDFLPPEEKMVDIVFGLIVPQDYNEEHLQLLSSLSQKLLKNNFCRNLRISDNSEELFQHLVSAYD